MDRTVTFKGNHLTLVGRMLTQGKDAPDFRAVSGDLKEVRLTDFRQKVTLISSFPSLDTPVCDLQVKEFDKKAVQLSSEVAVIGISKDLPFAQARFCSMNEIKNETVLSDYKYSSFGINYGFLIKELNLLARAVLIIDTTGIIRYLQVAEELSKPLQYEEALARLASVIKEPESADIKTEGLPAHCIPCEAGTPSLSAEKAEALRTQCPQWELIDGKKLVKEIQFKDFIDAKYFLDLVAVIAEEQGHHPVLTLNYNKLRITLTTHAAGGLTENDFIMAKVIDELGS